MSDVNGINFNNLGLGSANSSAKESGLGQDEFLKLMVAQLQNQDPMNPQTNGEFLGQMAQFSTVDGIQNLENSFSSLSTSLTSGQALQASALVGHSVLVSASSAPSTPTGIKGAVELNEPVSNLSVSIVGENGAVMKTMQLGAHNSDLANFTWDGTDADGNVMPQGNYQMMAQGVANGTSKSFSTLVSANVDGVTINSNGSGFVLNVAGLGAITMDQVKGNPP